MLTRCPHCQTAFRVTSEQLKARQGRVRCGACQRVFDALDTLSDEIAPIAPPPDDEEPETLAGQAPQFEPEPAFEPEPEPESEPEPEPEPEPEDAPPETESRPPQDGELVELPAPEADETPEPEPEPEPEQEAAPEAPPETAAETPPDEEWEEIAEPAPPRRWPWALGALLLLALGAGQLLYYFRVELAVMAPELRPTLEAGCALLDCTVPRPRKPELAGIEASDLVPAGADRLLLTATLKNRAPFAQEYPHLELTLTDTRDEALLRKVLAPADWLPAGQDAAAGFPARGEVAVRMLLEAPGVPAVGYRLYLFYP